jgi:UDP-N-acetylmuramoyl-tripeptide--D-alanyl-D-alanine ligase
MPVSLQEVLAATGGRHRGPSPASVVFGAAYTDSRQVQPGGLFIALRGEAQDGHAFIADALNAGATGILCREATLPAATVVKHAHFVTVPDTRVALIALAQQRLREIPRPVVAITGSAGKTTTKEMAAGILARKYRVLRSVGNLNTYTGIPLTALGLTPEHEVIVLEYAMSRVGEIAELVHIAQPDVAVVLNVGLAHVGFLGSIEGVASAKRELVEGVRPQGVTLLNGDDPRVRGMASASAAPVRFYGVGRKDWVRAAHVRLHGLDGSIFTLITPRGEVTAYLRVAGAQAVHDALAAAAIGEQFQVPLADIAAALQAFTPPARRMNTTEGPDGSLIIDDCYNSSPSSLRVALSVLQLADRRARRIAVLGDMLELGDHAAAAHEEAGRLVAKTAQYLVALGEHAPDMARGASAHGLPPERVVVAPGIAEAVRAVQAWIKPGAVILVKGSRGMHLEDVVEGLQASADPALH